MSEQAIKEVVCKDNRFSADLIAGKVYKVFKETEDSCLIENGGQKYWYSKHRFIDKVVNDKSDIESIATQIGKLVQEKNNAYGSAFAKAGEFLKILYPEGIKPEQYTDMLLIVRIFDKQMRLANKKDAFDESPYRDIAGYGILGAWIDEGREKA